MTLDTACSASLVPVDVVYRYLDSYQAESMLVGGTNMWLSPEHNQEIGMMNTTQFAFENVTVSVPTPTAT